MALFDSLVIVICELQRQRVTDIPTKQRITSIYRKFLDTGSIQNGTPRERPTAIREDKLNQPEQALSM